MPTSGVSLRLEWTLEAHSVPVSLVAQDSTGLLVTGGIDMSLTVWRSQVPLATVVLQSPNDKFRPMDRMRSLAIGPGGARLFAAAGERLWCLESTTLEELWSYHAPNMVSFLLSSPQGVGVVSSGDVVFSVDSGHLEVWTEDGRRAARWADNDAPNRFVVLSDGDRIVGSDGYSVCVWSVSERRKCARLDTRTRTYAFSTCPASHVFAIRTLRSVQVWDWQTGQIVFEREVSIGAPVLAVLPRLGWVAYAEQDGVTVVDPKDSSSLWLETPGVRVTTVGAVEGGLLVGRSDGSVSRFAIG
jgi:hypothetical protein